MSSLRSRLPRRAFDGFGFAQRSASPFAEPRDVEELKAILRRAAEEGVTVGLRGAGRSYGDASLNGPGIVLDLRRMNRILAWDPASGIAEVEPGVTIDALWRSALPDGYWPAVVPGTAAPTIGGCVAMNVHGKNHFRVGGTGDQVIDAQLLAPNGQEWAISREVRPDLFHAAIGSFGMLGVATRVRLRLKRVQSGALRVWAHAIPDLDAQLAFFEEHRAESDYLVSWVDCIAGGGGLGRGQAHRAVYVHDDPRPDLVAAHQDLPNHILGVPRPLVGKILALFNTNPGMRLVNLGKYVAARLSPSAPYLQGHVAFAFLLDYVDWRGAYAPGGLVQYQPFVPAAQAREVFGTILRRSQALGMPSYLGVIKRYRPDSFLLSHALDGFSLALDFRVTRSNREALWRMLREFNDLVLEAGGRFYPAKDSVMRPSDFERAWGQGAVGRFRALRAEVDPGRVLATEFARRVGVDPQPPG